MIYTHAAARDYCEVLLRRFNAPHPDKLEQRRLDYKGNVLDDDAATPYGALFFESNRDVNPGDENAYGNQRVSVGYTIPIADHDLKRRIISVVEPSAIGTLKPRGMTD